MRLYDVVLVFRTSVAASAREKLIESVKKWLGDGKVANIVDWGKKQLAYPIKKEKEGNYLILEVESEEGIPTDLEKRILMEESVLRHLVLRKN